MDGPSARCRYDHRVSVLPRHGRPSAPSSTSVREAVGRGLPPDVTAYLVGERLAPHLGTADLLTPEQREGDPDRYRQHVLHAEPDGSFSVVALVWLPGQRTAVHDHVSWCVDRRPRGRGARTPLPPRPRTARPPGWSRWRT